MRPPETTHRLEGRVRAPCALVSHFNHWSTSVCTRFYCVVKSVCVIIRLTVELTVAGGLTAAQHHFSCQMQTKQTTAQQGQQSGKL